MEQIPLEYGEEKIAYSPKTGQCLTVSKPTKDEATVQISAQDLIVTVQVEWLPDGTNEVTVRTNQKHS